MLGKDAHGIPKQACCGLATSAEQCVLNDDGFVFRERFTRDTMGDDPEEVMRRLAHGCGKLTGYPLCDFNCPGDMGDQVVLGES